MTDILLFLVAGVALVVVVEVVAGRLTMPACGSWSANSTWRNTPCPPRDGH